MIEAVSNDNLDDALPLIRAYQQFYKIQTMSDIKNKTFFSQFGINSQIGCQFLYTNEDQALGFATVFFSFSSTLAEKIAILNDLYVLPNNRNRGIGKQLIEHCRSYAEKNGCLRLQWLTSIENKQAQTLYDSIETNRSTWYFYTYNT